MPRSTSASTVLSFQACPLRGDAPIVSKSPVPARCQRMIQSIRVRLAAVATFAALGLGCGGSAQPATAPDPRIPKVVLPTSRLFVLEMSGIPPEDSIVTFAVTQPRVIILRHGAPDNTV